VNVTENEFGINAKHLGTRTALGKITFTIVLNQFKESFLQLFLLQILYFIEKALPPFTRDVYNIVIYVSAFTRHTKALLVFSALPSLISLQSC
jgi:uncharacterized membrane protein YidH (DUF202 family)